MRRLLALVFVALAVPPIASAAAPVSPLAHQLQNLTPDLAQDGPNTEYPWSHKNPSHCPATHSFDLWDKLRDSEPGRRLVKFIQRAIERFDQYA